jgi:hypothetical protein
MWKLPQILRITSSNFQQIFKRQKENVDKLLVQFSNKTKSIETPALQWGRKCESIAKKLRSRQASRIVLKRHLYGHLISKTQGRQVSILLVACQST